MKPVAKTWKEWEKPLIDLDDAISKLRKLASVERDPEHKKEIERKVEGFEERRVALVKKRYGNLTPWERVLIARAEPRPYTLDYVQPLFPGFVELGGDRRFGEDKSLIGGPATFEGRPVMVVGQQKGRDIQQRAERNFAMMKPEGYRKAIRLFEMADRFQMPVVSFVDTPAADPGPESESRGVGEAIAASMQAMLRLKVPVVVVVIGEGGSGGAMGIAVGNKVLMLEHAIYSVIPPEGCAAILWRKPEEGPRASEALGLTAEDSLRLGVIDKILPEPFGGAHRDVGVTVQNVREGLVEALEGLDGLSPEELKRQRIERFANLGVFEGS